MIICSEDRLKNLLHDAIEKHEERTKKEWDKEIEVVHSRIDKTKNEFRWIAGIAVAVISLVIAISGRMIPIP